MTEHRLRVELCTYSQRLHERGFVANHDGNISVRLGPGRYLATPTATSKAMVQSDNLVIVDDAGARVSGNGRPFSEMALHLCVYRERPDVQVVMHAHPVTATGFAVAGRGLEVPFLPEAVVSLGPGIPLVPLAAPGGAAVAALKPYPRAYDAVLLGGNGVLTWGSDLEQAYLRLELVEHLARIALVAQQLGGVQGLPAAMMPPLLEARRKAGLMPPGAGEAVKGEAAGAGKEEAPKAAAPAARTTPDLATIIRQELTAAMKR